VNIQGAWSDALKGFRSMRFFSDFESGNLGRITELNASEYELEINPDTNNGKFRLWFYFGVEIEKGACAQKCLFHITNFSKTKSCYRLGMSPLVRSTLSSSWSRIEESDCFYYRSPKHDRNYVLSFVHEFEQGHGGEVYYFAYSYPYTYTDLQKYLHRLERLEMPFLQRKLLCRTIQNRRMDILTITNPDTGANAHSKKKKHVMITARVHPGETPAQYICQGLIDLLVSDHPLAVAMRDKLVFKIIPMLNPDGVFLGNYRCSSLGFDLNRHWTNPSWCQPEVKAAKQMLLDFYQDPDIDMDFFIDLHAHSAATNGFMYCNEPGNRKDSSQARVFPRLLDKQAPTFSLQQTRFDMDPSKEGSGRRALGELFPDVHCYTLEVSFFASTSSLEEGNTTGAGRADVYGETCVPYTQDSYMELGRNVALTFAEYYRIKAK